MHGLWLRLVDSGHLLLDFMAAGGVVMWALAVLCVLYWTLVFERLWYMRRVFPRWVDARRQAWARLASEPGTGSARYAAPGWRRLSSNWPGPLRLSKRW